MPSKSYSGRWFGVVSRAAAAAVLCTGFAACGDSDGGGGSPVGAGGAAGNPTHSAGEVGESGEAGEVGHGGVGSGTGGSGGSGGIAGDEGGSGGVTYCTSDEECADGTFCNGKEVCASVKPGAELKVCFPAPTPPCAEQDCNERERTCDCTNGDRDADDAFVPYCAQLLGKPVDCDDDDIRRFPGRTETCDPNAPEHDEDCNDQTFGFLDADKDGYIDERCANRNRYGGYNRGTDCNDQDPKIHPHAEELCDDIDNDCDGERDETDGTPEGEVHYYHRDADGDFHGSESPDDVRKTRCAHPPAGYVVQAGDCDDEDPSVNPSREERCNGKDDDCRGGIDKPDKPGQLLFDEPFDGVTEFECRGAEGWIVTKCPRDRLNCFPYEYLDACETPGTTLCNCHECGTACRFSCGETACEDVESVSAGGHHTCAVVAPVDGSEGGSVVCWGGNDRGQLGYESGPVSLVPTKIPELRQVHSVAAGFAHTCAIAGTPMALYCWGDDSAGQLGTTRADDFSNYPLAISLLSGEVTNVAAAWEHTCAIHETGWVSCWGQTEGGRVGNDFTESRIIGVPTRVVRDGQGIDDAVQLALGDEHSCSLSAHGEVDCWGDNTFGQLGDGFSVPNSGVALRIALPVAVKQIAAGPYHTCALTNGGDVYCWGSNESYALGVEGDGGLPEQVPGLGEIEALACGLSFTCVLDAAGNLRCFGSNSYGESGGTESTPLPARIDLTQVEAVFGGNGVHACAMDQSRQVQCWGYNGQGQLGDGTEDNGSHAVPLPLRALAGSAACVSDGDSDDILKENK